jgi:tight adherence protein C
MVILQTTILLSALPSNRILPLLASGLVGAALFVFIRTIRNTLYTEDYAQDNDWRYDLNRMNELRQHSILYRMFQPVIQGLARFNRGMFRDDLPVIAREIQTAGLSRFWTPEEYLGQLELISIMMMPVYMYFCVDMMGSAGWVLAVMLSVMTAYFLRRRLAFQALYRLFKIKQRLPFLLDLLTLLMEAGSTFLQALGEAVTEFRDHAVGVEFGRVLGEINMGKNRTAALEALRDRLRDDEITSIVGSIIQGERLGTPLAQLFRTQADVLRIKRSQRAETIAGEAGVKMLMPGILVMASTVLIILGPFILNFVLTDILS